MATTPQAAKLSDILTSIITQLVAVTEIDPAYVKLVASDNYKITCLEPKFLYVRPLGLNPSTNAGAGRRARPVSRSIRVYMHTRSNLDVYTSDDIALDAVDGHEALELMVIDAIDEFWPTNTDGDLITIEPLHPLDSSSGPPTREAENDQGLVTSHFDFEIVYLNLVNTPQP